MGEWWVDPAIVLWLLLGWYALVVLALFVLGALLDWWVGESE